MGISRYLVLHHRTRKLSWSVHDSISHNMFVRLGVGYIKYSSIIIRGHIFLLSNTLKSLPQCTLSNVLELPG